MLGAMVRRGASQAGVWRQGSTVLAVARQRWEFGPGFSGPVLAVEDGDCTVVADASLYYRDDLRRKLAAQGVRPCGQTPSHLILAAYRAWGEACPAQLDGDFAFVLYDRRARRVLAARDFVGSRPLFYAELGKVLVIASSIGAILEHPACAGELNLEAIGTDAAGLSYAATDDTCYRGMRRLYAGWTLTRDGGASRVRPHWEPQVAEPRRAPSFDEGAEELRALLCTAVAERLDPSGASSMWLSGGWDSPAVFAAGQHVLAARGDAADRLRAVSVSHPAGDPGYEDDKITAIRERWSAPVT